MTKSHVKVAKLSREIKVGYFLDIPCMYMLKIDKTLDHLILKIKGSANFILKLYIFLI